MMSFIACVLGWNLVSHIEECEVGYINTSQQLSRRDFNPFNHSGKH